MFEPTQARATGLDLRHEHPFLFPWNRRLRNLHGISLRNLNTTPSTNRVRGKTITDDDVPYTLASPAKRLLQHEGKGLSHSKSLTNLTGAVGKSSHLPQNDSTSSQENEKIQTKPERGRLRRRSTLHWSSTHPRLRQKKLEDVTLNHLADSWVSIHNRHAPEPVYISEIMEKSMNPSFAFFDLDTTNSKITRDENFIIKVWAKDDRAENFSLLVDLDLNMRSLQYIGRSLEAFHHPLPQNCILLHLSDGIYTSFTDLPSEDFAPWNNLRDSKNQHQTISSSFDALLQLGNLDECIQDALKTRAQLEGDIDAILAARRSYCEQRKTQTEDEEQASSLKSAISVERKQKTQLMRRREDLKDSLGARRKAMADGRVGYEKAKQRSADLKKCNGFVSENVLRNTDRSNGQVRRIMETVLKIFPIEPIRNKTLQFTIRGIYLPNSVFDDTNRDEIAAALGFTSQLVHHLSFYLSVPLPYPLEPNSSNSFIRDPISVGLAQRQFPLHPTTVGYKFEYGVFLLNKDIEFLMNRSGLRVLDIRHTLPNLKYLLYVLTAGSGDLPIRKAGGVRGLIGGRLTPSLSRRSSEDSVSTQGEYVKPGSGDRSWNGITTASVGNDQGEKHMGTKNTAYSSRKLTSHLQNQTTLHNGR